MKNWKTRREKKTETENETRSLHMRVSLKQIYHLLKCFTSAGKCFPRYNGHEFLVKHTQIIPANHNNGKLDQKNRRKKEERKITSALCASFSLCKNRRGGAFFILMWGCNNSFVLNFQIQYMSFNCYNSQFNSMNWFQNWIQKTWIV